MEDPNVYATLAATGLALISVYLQHKVSERNRKIRVAAALSAEIEEIYDIKIQALKRDRAEIMIKAEAGVERFTTWGARDEYAIYDNIASDIMLLNSETIRAVVKYYQIDSELQAKVMNMASDNFFQLEKSKKMEYVKEIFLDLEGLYEAAYRGATAKLNAATVRKLGTL